MGYAVLLRRLQGHQTAQHVINKHVAVVSLTEAHAGRRGRKIHKQITALEYGFTRAPFPEVPLDKDNVRANLIETRKVTAVEVVHDSHSRSRLNDARDKIGAEEAAAASDDNPLLGPVCQGCTRSDAG